MWSSSSAPARRPEPPLRPAKGSPPMTMRTALLAGLGLLALGCGDANDPDEPKATTTDSGLKYFDKKVGDGAEVKKGVFADVYYTGTLRSGKKFDSNHDRGKPFTFQIGQGVIAGWSYGVQGMKVGGKRKLTIAPDLAYGDRGQGDIPPLSTLLFEIELLDIK